MWNDPNWFYTEEPNVMWGRQLEYREVTPRYTNGETKHLIVTPDQRRFSNLRDAFACYRVGFGESGPDDDQLEVMRRTMSWIHCGRYEQPIIPAGGVCPSSNRLQKIDDRRIICDVFGGSRALFQHYLIHLEMLRLVTQVTVRSPCLTREGQAVLIMLEISRPRSGSSTKVTAASLEYLTRTNRWLAVDPNQWAAGIVQIQSN